MKITAILASLAILATGAAAQVEEAAFNLGRYIAHNAVGISEEEAFKIGHYIAHNAVGISEEEQNMAFLTKKYYEANKFSKVAEEENIINPVAKAEFDWLHNLGHMHSKFEDEEEAMSLKTMLDRYNKVKKFIPLSEEEEAFKLGHYITHNVIGINEEEDMSLKTMLDRYNKVKKFIPLSEAEEAMSLKTMLDRYNKVKKFIPVAEEEALKPRPLRYNCKRSEGCRNFIKMSEEEALKFHPLRGVCKRSEGCRNFKNMSEVEALKLNPNFVACKGTAEVCRRHDPLIREEAAFNIKNYIKHNVIGISEEEEQNMSLKTMLDRYNKAKKFIPLSEEEEAFKRNPNEFGKAFESPRPPFPIKLTH